VDQGESHNVGVIVDFAHLRPPKGSPVFSEINQSASTSSSNTCCMNELGTRPNRLAELAPCGEKGSGGLAGYGPKRVGGLRFGFALIRIIPIPASLEATECVIRG
jgi:hypothetical protein